MGLERTDQRDSRDGQGGHRVEPSEHQGTGSSDKGSRGQVEELHDEDDGFVTEEDDFSDPSEVGASDPSSSKRKKRSGGPAVDDDADGFSDLDADSDDEEVGALVPFDPSTETVFDRLYALRDIIPPTTRARLYESAGNLSTGVKTGGRWLGGLAWVVTTSMLLVGLPMVLSVEAESMLVAQEREIERQQQGQQVGLRFVLCS